MDISKVYQFGSHLPDGVKNIGKFATYRAICPAAERDMAVLNAVAKSGRHYFHHFMGNYINVLLFGAREPVDMNAVATRILPNTRDGYIQGTRPWQPNPVCEPLPVLDFVVGHSTRFLAYSKARIVFLYRNPLDYAVSLYFQRQANLPDKMMPYPTPSSYLDRALDYYIEHVMGVRPLIQSHHILPVSYERLRRAPQASFGTAIEWLGLPLDIGALDRAISFADFSVMKQQEKEDKENGDGYFASGTSAAFHMRKGQVGDWKNHFDDADISRIEARLRDHGLTLRQFELE